MLIIKEELTAESKAGPKRPLNYAIGEIHMDDAKSYMIIYIRTRQNFDRLVEFLKKLYPLTDKYLSFPKVPFNTTYHEDTKSFKFEKDIKTALELLVSMDAMSKVTYKEALAHLKNDNQPAVKLKACSP